MNIGKTSLIILLIIILGMGIKIYYYFNPNFEKCFIENNEFFNLNRKELNLIVIDINKLKFKEGYNISIDEIPIGLKNRMSKIGIDSFSFKTIIDFECKEKHSIEFNIVENWNIEQLRNVKLIYNPCDKKLALNYHYYDGFHIDTWGQGRNWFIFSDTDFM